MALVSGLKQPSVLGPDQPVALARAGPTHPEVTGNGSVADADLVVIQEVLGQQQPAPHAIVNGVVRVAKRYLSSVDHPDLDIGQGQTAERRVSAEERLGIRGL